MAPWGIPEVLRQGEETCLVGAGSTTRLMMDAASLCRESRRGDPTVVDARFLKPLHEETFLALMREHRQLVVAEEAYLSGGVGEALAALAHREDLLCRVRTLGVSDRFVPQATRAEQWQEEGLTPERVVSLLHAWTTTPA